ncbi:hypothetical protein RJT34_20418 [Clitoria ternatea]|uniref:Rho termination factor N-terminal domain-containing protein n=1 Tax=Clitoria ternatea TaxID=43366 RepID=A0AAN9IT68_CLITE
MAWDLWTSSSHQVASGGNYSQHSEWQCDFYFGCDRDVIEEDALNEESCVRVLRILITNADTEIEELEKDLLFLQNELALAEHEKWPDICCTALTERINRLDVAVSALKCDSVDDSEVQLLLHGKPAETLHDIVKALQRDLCQHTLGAQLKQHLEMNLLNPIVDATGHALDQDSSSIGSSVIVKTEGKELCGTSESSELLPELHENRSNNPEKIEEVPENSLVRSPDLGDIICAPDHSDRMEFSETSDNEVTENDEGGRSPLIATDTGQIVNLFSAKDNGNIPSETKNENEIVKEKDVGSDDFRAATGGKGRKKCPQRKSGKSDLDKKLCDFAPKTTRRTCKKESKVAPEEDLDSLNSPLQIVYPQSLCIADTDFTGSNGNNTGEVINMENATLIHAENSALISLLETQSKSATHTGIQPTDEEKPQAQDLESEIAATLSQSNMNFPSKLKRAQGNQKPGSEAFPTREPHNSSTEVIPSTSITVPTKRQRKYKSRNDNAVINESMNMKITKKAVQRGLSETEDGAIVLYDSKFSESQKKRRVSKLPITGEIQNSTVNLDAVNSDRVSMDNGSQVDVPINNSCSLVDPHNDASSLPPVTLKSLSLTTLRAMAKQHNVKKYYKLAKGALVERLSEQLSSC